MSVTYANLHLHLCPILRTPEQQDLWHTPENSRPVRHRAIPWAYLLFGTFRISPLQGHLLRSNGVQGGAGEVLDRGPRMRLGELRAAHIRRAGKRR